MYTVTYLLFPWTNSCQLPHSERSNHIFPFRSQAKRLTRLTVIFCSTSRRISASTILAQPWHHGSLQQVTFSAPLAHVVMCDSLLPQELPSLKTAARSHR